MKKLISFICAIIMLAFVAVGISSCDFGSIDIGNGGNTNPPIYGDCSTGDHADQDDDEYCDLCGEYVIVVVDFYVLNDLHGKFCDTDTQPGVDELGTYFAEMAKKDDNMVILSSGDMWQGTAESNLTRGKLVTEWMNEMNFVSMTLGNHEYDWGEGPIKENAEIAEFPFLAINIYDVKTNQRVDYCEPSVMVERGGLKIGIIGAIGDCYSSISSDMVEGVKFLVGGALTALVKDEADRLRAEGADLIVYALHDGYESSKSGTSMVGDASMRAYYDSVLSGGYVDLVFEAHTHQRYTLVDSKGVYHMQAGGENYGLSHVEIAVNSANGFNKVREAGVVGSNAYSSLADDAATEALEDKYAEIIDFAYSELGTVSRKYIDSELEDLVAELYLEAGIATWGEEYDIVLAGGFLKTRSPYDLSAGKATYADILSLLPFDNRLCLCSVSGSSLLSRFINTTNSDYHNAYSEYGESIKGSISSSATYYVVVDTYTALYAYNNLTIVEFYDDNIFARDLVADAIRDGRLEIKHEGYTLTSAAEAINIGNTLGNNQATKEYYYLKGRITSINNDIYGNIYIVDENGDEIYVYGLYDLYGKRFDAMSEKPKVGDTIVVYSVIYKFVYNSQVTVELKNATLIDVE